MESIHDKRFSNRFWTILLRDYVHSSVLNASGIATKIKAKPSTIDYLLQNMVQIIKSFKTLPNERKKDKILKNNKKILYGFHYKEDIIKTLDAELPPLHPFLRGKGDPEKRIKAKAYADTLEDKFSKALIYNLPEYAVEHFEKLYNKVPLYNPTEKEFHVINIDTLFIKMLLAKYTENGSKLIQYEAGWGGGEKYRVHYSLKAISDRYMTWGWKIDEDDVPSKAFRCAGFEKRYNAGSKTGKKTCLLCYPSVGPNNVDLMAANTDEFLQKVNWNKFSNIIARPRPYRKLGDVTHQINFINNENVGIDSGKSDIAKLIKDSEIVVHFALPSTTFLECLYVDHPIITIYNNTRPTELVKPFYKFFFEKKILHEDVDSLVNHLNEVNVKEWWQEIIKEPMFQEFKNTFARRVD